MDASEELRADHEIVLAIVQQFGDSLRYASEELRADLEIVLAAVQKEGRALQYALRGAPRRPRDRLGGRAAEWSALADASEELRAGHVIVLAAAHQRDTH
jgi:hypothetical protein